MLTRHHGRAALESIAFQDTRFFDAVADAFQTLKDSAPPPKTADVDDLEMRQWAAQANLPDIVNQFTNLNIDFQCAQTTFSAAHTYLPDLDRNHPLVDDFRRTFMQNKDSKAGFRRAEDILIGSVDLEKGKVTGIYTQIESPIFIGAELITSPNYTVREIAAIFLHEVGHLMTYYEYLGRMLLVTHVLGDLSKDFKGVNTKSQKVEIAKIAKESLSLDNFDADVITEDTSIETLTTLVVSEYANKRHSATNSSLFDSTTTEALADQYVSRLGGGRDLVTALDKLNRTYGSRAYQSTLVVCLNRVIKLVIIIASMVILPVFGVTLAIAIFASLFLTEMEEEYDEPKVRIDRIRQDYVQAMKRPNISKEIRKSLQKDFEAINELMSKVGYETSWFKFIWKTIVPSVRKQVNLDKELRQLENLANNDLFAHHNKLKTLA